MSNAEVLGRFIWHELLTTDTVAAAGFYSKVVPWRTQPSNMPGYTIFMAGQTQIGGLMALPADPGGTPAHWLVYVGTPNVDATCAQARGLGGRICKEATDIPNVGRFAVLADPQGATFAVFTPSGGPPPAGPPAQGGFTWHELATTDVAAALRFYGELFGWRKGAGHDMGAMGVYQLFEFNGAAAGGMCSTQGPSTPPSWLSYVHVVDSARAVAAVKSSGGRLLHGPMEVPGGSWIALFMDPQGGAFAVQEMPRTASSAAPPKPATAIAGAAAKPAARAAKPKKAAPKKASRKQPARRKVARKKLARKKVARSKVTRKPARRKAAKKKVARRAARRAAPRKRARARRGR